METLPVLISSLFTAKHALMILWTTILFSSAITRKMERLLNRLQWVGWVEERDPT